MGSTPRHALITELHDLMSRVATAHATVTPPESWMDAALTMPQVKAMLVIYHRGAVRVGSIAHELGMSPNAATALLDRLEALEFAQREPDPSDRRAILVVLTEAGTNFVGDILSAGANSVNRFLEQMSVDDLSALHRGMTSLVGLIEQAAASTADAPTANASATTGSRH
jgi:DNA-binding MarR family transcriptional regulator